MAERMAAEIWIGGKVTLSQADALAKAVAQEGVALDWGQKAFVPDCGEELLEARCRGNGANLLRLCAEEACGGAMDQLESFLGEEQISFRRYGDGKYEFDAEMVEYRPDLGWPAPRSWPASAGGDPLVAAALLRQIADRLDRAAGTADENELRAAVQAAAMELTSLLPPERPPLPDFEIEIEAAAS